MSYSTKMHSTKLLFDELVIRQKLSTKCRKSAAHRIVFLETQTSLSTSMADDKSSEGPSIFLDYEYFFYFQVQPGRYFKDTILRHHS